LGCGPELFDCDAGLPNWNNGWSTAKKAWCCENKEKGCPEGLVVRVPRAEVFERNTDWQKAHVDHGAIPHLEPDALSEEAMDAAEPGFEDLDCIDKDGVITIHEAATYGVKNGVPWGEIRPIFDVMDMNKDNEISREEFDQAHPVSHAVFQDFRAGFKDIDLDSDGLISENEWMSYCNGWMTKKPQQHVCEELFKAGDTEAPMGEIDQHEFYTAGSHCSSIDDGDCKGISNMQIALAIAATSVHGHEVADKKAPATTPELRGSKATATAMVAGAAKETATEGLTGAQLLGALARLNLSRRAPAPGPA